MEKTKGVLQRCSRELMVDIQSEEVRNVLYGCLRVKTFRLKVSHCPYIRLSVISIMVQYSYGFDFTVLYVGFFLANFRLISPISLLVHSF